MHTSGYDCQSQSTVGVCVGSGVAVAVAVGFVVGVRVFVGAGLVAVGGILVGVRVGVLVGSAVSVGCGVLVASRVAVGSGVSVGAGVFVGDDVRVAVTVDSSVRAGLCVAVGDGDDAPLRASDAPAAKIAEPSNPNPARKPNCLPVIPKYRLRRSGFRCPTSPILAAYNGDVSQSYELSYFEMSNCFRVVFYRVANHKATARATVGLQSLPSLCGHCNPARLDTSPVMPATHQEAPQQTQRR